jgi:hypothetical protein
MSILLPCRPIFQAFLGQLVPVKNFGFRYASKGPESFASVVGKSFLGKSFLGKSFLGKSFLPKHRRYVHRHAQKTTSGPKSDCCRHPTMRCSPPRWPMSHEIHGRIPMREDFRRGFGRGEKLPVGDLFVAIGNKVGVAT